MRQAGIPHPRLPLPPAGQGDDLISFRHWLEEAIPLVSQLGIKGLHWQDDALVWSLSLDPNLNDKGTGFGGSLAAQTTLIGWCWATLWLRSQGRDQNVVVAEATQRFQAPVTGDYRLVCRPEDPSGPAALAERLASRGKGRLVLVQELFCGDTLCLTARGDYAVLP
ncbi:YiiD C-terminal domain-containing protein [Halomonas sp. YLGW01]|uniref:YiiD C-terminal domain-containing protein n=1 Tax=Halomonas sp. YLGW01 TaxID=2773308 RepID=UPI00177AAC33|nr:YiiD C-terminal domain-containing protein [Halomonas sp. YLGW01]